MSDDAKDYVQRLQDYVHTVESINIEMEKASENPQNKSGGVISRFSLKTISLLIFLFIIPALAYAGQFKIIRVTDGDTVTVLGNGKKIQIRLVGIDSPEMSRGKHKPGQSFCQKSQKYLEWLVLNETVKIKSYGLDRYGRILGVVFTNGKNANLEMVKAGLAEVYRGRSPTDFDVTIFQQAEKAAREAKSGIWVQGDKYVSPREWRKKNRDK